MNRLLLLVLSTLAGIAACAPELPGSGAELRPKYLVGLGEYQCFIINTATGKLYGISSNLAALGIRYDDGTPGFVRPSGVSNKDWRVYEVVNEALMEFEVKFKAMWA